MVHGLLLGMVPNVLRGGAADVATFTITTTGAETLSLDELDVAVGETLTVFWGDGNSSELTGEGTNVTHDYASAGTWTVTMSPATAVTRLNVDDSKFGCSAGAIGALTSLTYLRLANLANATIGAGEIGALTSLTTLALDNLASVTIGAGEIGSLTSLTSLILYKPTNITIGAGEIGALTSLTSLTLYDSTNITIGAGEIGSLTSLTSLNLSILANATIGAGEIGALTSLTSLILNNLTNATIGAGDLATQPALTSVRIENSLSQAAVDQVLADLYSAFPTRTGTNGTIDLLGGSNAAPTGTSPGGAECPPTDGWNTAYELVNDSCDVSAKHWASVSLQT